MYTVHVNTVHVGRSKRRILDAAQRLHVEHGLDAVSMRNVAEVVGVVPAAIYRHFASKEDLLDAMVDTGFAMLEEELAKARTLANLMRRFLNFSLAEPRLYELMFLRRRENARKFPADFRAGKSGAFNVPHRLVAAEGFPGDPLDVTFNIWAHAHGLISMYTLGRFSYGEAEFIRFYERSMRRLLDGIRKGKSK